MGLLVDGSRQDRWYDTDAAGGKFERTESDFRSWITADGSPGPSGDGGFPAARGRYHPYASYACPWAHRVPIWRAPKGLEDAIDVSFVHRFMDDEGWTFEPDPHGIVGDRLGDRTRLHRVHTSADPRFTGRVTVPALWDTERNTIVSNESSEIVRTLDTAFDTLDALEEILSRRCFLTGDAPLEADWRLFPTLLRFDLVYHAPHRDPGRRGHRSLRAAHRCAGEPDRDGLEGARERRRVLRRHRARPQPRRAEPLRVGRRGAAPLRRGPGRSRRPRRATPGRPRATSPRARTRMRAPARA